MVHAIWRVYGGFIVWKVLMGLGQLNEWLCCSLEFVGFERYGVFEEVRCFISAVSKT